MIALGSTTNFRNWMRQRIFSVLLPKLMGRLPGTSSFLFTLITLSVVRVKLNQWVSSFFAGLQAPRAQIQHSSSPTITTSPTVQQGVPLNDPFSPMASAGTKRICMGTTAAGTAEFEPDKFAVDGDDFQIAAVGLKILTHFVESGSDFISQIFHFYLPFCLLLVYNISMQVKCL